MLVFAIFVCRLLMWRKLLSGFLANNFCPSLIWPVRRSNRGSAQAFRAPAQVWESSTKGVQEGRFRPPLPHSLVSVILCWLSNVGEIFVRLFGKQFLFHSPQSNMNLSFRADDGNRQSPRLHSLQTRFPSFDPESILSIFFEPRHGLWAIFLVGYRRVCLFFMIIFGILHFA